MLGRDSAREFLIRYTSRDVQRAFDEAPQASRRANIVRFAYLLVHGGIYADADERCLMPLREWLPHTAAFVGNRKDFGLLTAISWRLRPAAGSWRWRWRARVAGYAAETPDLGDDSIFILDYNIEQKVFSSDFPFLYKKTREHCWIDEYENS